MGPLFSFFIFVLFYCSECENPKLLKFGGRAKDFSPRARFRSFLGLVFGWKYLVCNVLCYDTVAPLRFNYGTR